MAKKKKKFVVIDGNALIHRAFHALPPLTTKKGVLVNAAYGFTSILLKVIRELKPSHLAVAFDVKKKTFRHEEFAEYKAKRVKAPQELYDQIPLVKQIVKAFNIPVLEAPGYEADDVIGTLVNRKTIDQPDVETVIVTGDMDTLQLIDDNTKVYTLRQGFSDTVLFDAAMVKERYGLEPSQIVDFKALAGDPSDNIPGVAGIGKQTATKLLQAFGSLKNIYARLEKDETAFSDFRARVVELLQKHKQDAKLSQHLAEIVTVVPLNFKLTDAEHGSYDRDAAIALFRELEFKSLLTKLPEVETQSAFRFGGQDQTTQSFVRVKTPGYFLVNTIPALKKLLTVWKKQTDCAIDTETTSLDPLTGDLLGLSVSWKKGEAAYIALPPGQSFRTEALTILKSVLSNPKILKHGHNLKYDLAVLKRVGLEVHPIGFDSMIASYLLNPSSRQHGLDALAFTEFGHEMIPIEELIGKKGKNQKTMDSVPIDDLAEYACEDADFTYQLVQVFRKQLKEKNLISLMEKIEMPLVPVLAAMEERGVLIDTGFLKTMSRQIEKKIIALEKKIYQQAGQEFNINSPAQMKVILFDKLDIETEGIGMTKTGYSTAASELEKMEEAHPIVPLIMEYRELAKLKSTYIDALPELVKKETGRVHTSFNQTIAATGRLSSTNPNLQNIPIRTELGREIRKSFVAPRGFRIISADYSQIELRLVASIANDKNMMEAFRNGEDIHSRTAAEIQGCDIDEVSKDMRRAAKTINFGILYGMGTYGLARAAKLDVSEASEYIETYFEKFSGVHQYIEETKALARKLGYVETLFGRRRYIPEIDSRVRPIRAGAERMAVNMPIQGTAADILKLAMIEIHAKIASISPETIMVLQVHDELVFETPYQEVEKVSRFVAEAMAGVTKLKVPIVVEVEAGNNWGELTPVEKKSS
ncbi:MAG: DNA polymerase I [bacterium]|nr:DNA polymerase I [bacterium]